MTTKIAKGTNVGWVFPEDLGQPPPNAHETHMRKTAFTTRVRGVRVLSGRVSTNDGDNSDILLPVQKRQAVLDSFYDNRAGRSLPSASPTTRIY